jgi:indolepyruvate ferredoxin oxidoreductase beta subunit
VTATRPITILIAALGGEGGGVLSGWIVSAAESLGLPVQSTSIPGVAQRTGATTYYIEIWPEPWSVLGGRQPVLALLPGIADIDVLLASELMEAARAVAAGFVTADRTLSIASTARFHVMDEKIAMGDGRADVGKLSDAITRNSRQHVLFDMAAAARRSGAIVNAVMLGALAGGCQLPIPAEAFEAAIRQDGKAVDANLRGFRAGLDAVRNAAKAAAVPTQDRGGAASPADLDRAIASFPVAARDTIAQGVRRLVSYQSATYARLYLDRLGLIAKADAQAGAGDRLLTATARHLAVRMSYEDVVRVAQAKIDPARFGRIMAESSTKPGDLVTVTEFLKPGIAELCSILPPGLARRILDLAQRRGWLDRVHWGMEIKSTSITGYLRFWLLAKLRAWRPRSHRYVEEQHAIEAWLGLIVQAASRSAELAGEVAECARLIKGYGDTHHRGTTNYRLIETLVIVPAIAGRIPLARAVDAIASARTAALTDPDGEALSRCLAEIGSQSTTRIAAE